MQHDEQEAELLLRLQRGLPLAPRPFAQLGAGVDLTEEQVLDRVRALFERGLARRLGGVFDGRALGYRSTLAAAAVPADALETAAARLAPEPGITHLYAREGCPSLWFTITAPADGLAAACARLTAALAPWEVLNLPTRRTFKIGVVLDPRALRDARPEPADAVDRWADPEAPPDPRADPPTPAERALVRRLQQRLPVTAAPFADLAVELGWTEAALLARLETWQQAGVLRRVGLVLYHRAAGFQANAMCVWQVPDDRVGAAGWALARSPDVTHCYERVAHPSFPFNLFAMLHAGARPAAAAAADRLAVTAGLPHVHLLFSTREFKKTSPVFFAEPPA